MSCARLVSPPAHDWREKEAPPPDSGQAGVHVAQGAQRQGAPDQPETGREAQPVPAGLSTGTELGPEHVDPKLDGATTWKGCAQEGADAAPPEQHAAQTAHAGGCAVPTEPAGLKLRLSPLSLWKVLCPDTQSASVKALATGSDLRSPLALSVKQLPVGTAALRRCST